MDTKNKGLVKKDDPNASKGGSTQGGSSVDVRKSRTKGVKGKDSKFGTQHKWTEEEILNDDDLWKLTDDEGSDNDKSETSGSFYDVRKRNMEYWEDDDTVEKEEGNMTRYLMERPPDLDRGRSDLMDLSRKTKKERKALILR